MSFKYFIDTTYIKENTPIQDNLDAKLIQMSLQDAQEITLRDTIGSDLYDEIYSQYPSSLSADNTNLLNDYIKPILKYAVLQDAVMPLTFKFMNKSITLSCAFHNACPGHRSDVYAMAWVCAGLAALAHVDCRSMRTRDSHGLSRLESDRNGR